MRDLFERDADEFEIVPSSKIAGRVEAVLHAPGRGFQTVECDRLDLSFDGIRDDYHRGLTRRSGGREPWYPRGTEIRNERQVSIVAADELAAVARDMGIAGIRPEWVGANLVIGGVARLSMLPAGTLIFFNGGATLKVDGQNRPCRLSGRSIGEHAREADPIFLETAFVKVARRRRGLVAWVEKPGSIVAGEGVSMRLPDQWVYRG